MAASCQSKSDENLLRERERLLELIEEDLALFDIAALGVKKLGDLTSAILLTCRAPLRLATCTWTSA